MGPALLVEWVYRRRHRGRACELVGTDEGNIVVGYTKRVVE